jgi:hypothetical protein
VWRGIISPWAVVYTRRSARAEGKITIVATGTAQSAILPPAPPVPGESRERERIIRRQLARTGLQVRLVDLASSLALWIIGVLLLFIGAALFDHFIGLGSVGRFVALTFLVKAVVDALKNAVPPVGNVAPVQLAAAL